MISGVRSIPLRMIDGDPPPLPNPMEWRHLLAMSSFRAPVSPVVLLLLMDPYPTKQLRAVLQSSSLQSHLRNSLLHFLSCLPSRLTSITIEFGRYAKVPVSIELFLFCALLCHDDTILRIQVACVAP